MLKARFCRLIGAENLEEANRNRWADKAPGYPEKPAL